jgi:hypothetical protein
VYLLRDRVVRPVPRVRDLSGDRSSSLDEELSAMAHAVAEGRGVVLLFDAVDRPYLADEALIEARTGLRVIERLEDGVVLG